ncbi:MAG TPA: protein kinase [Blastocatellia bacterium]|nr:protein kinase [Blastocatellia bacterium]
MMETIAHYRLLERLGSGGAGEVYRAEDQRLHRIVALKRLSPAWHADAQARLSLEREAQAAAACNHPNIAVIYELGQADGWPYIVMEYVEGRTLAAEIEQGAMDIARALDIAAQAAAALQAAHERGLVHSDIKSSNLMLTSAGRVKVLDFGLSRFASGLPADAQAAGENGGGAVRGTVSYMSPEQARGETLDARTDLFSLGVVLYEMTAGSLPFTGANRREVLAAILEREPPLLRALRDDAPLELESIIRKALEKNREERYQSASAMLADLISLKARLEESRPQAHNVAEEEATPPGESPRASLALRLFRQGLRRDPAAAAHAPPQGAAFRGLLPFQEIDRERFYGREIETAALLEMVTHEEFRFGLLYGDSGCGKTSLVRAGLLPGLKGKGYTPIYCRSYKEPLAALLAECRRQSKLEMAEGETPMSYLRRVAAVSGAGLVFVCDQYEEFFVNFKSRRRREPFVAFVVACNQAADLPVKFLFSMRADFLYLIGADFDGRIPEPLMVATRYHLRNFDEERAAEIIEKSAQRAGLPFEKGLSAQAARDLAVNDTVLPSELQIVGEQLQNRRIFTLQEYRRIGGKEQLAHAYLEDVIRAAPDQKTARLVLRALISDENTRLTLPLAEIVRRTQRSRPAVERALRLFARARLIRELQDDEPWRYELMHEYLIEKINQATGRVLDATQRANRLLRQYLSNYAVDKRTRIPLGKLWVIRRYADMERGERGRELLRKSLWWGGLKAGALVMLLAVVTTMAAAALSVTEEWEGVRLRDGHTAAALRAAFSPDGRLLVSVGEDAKVIVWDFARRQRLATFTDHTDWVFSVAFSPDGKWFATASNDRTVIVWDAMRLEKAAVLTEHRDWVRAVAFSPDGRLLASSSGGSAEPDSRTILWEVGRWKKVRELPFGCYWSRLLFTPDGRHLVTSSEQVWDVQTGRQVADSPFLPWGANGAAFSPDGKLAAGIDAYGAVAFFDLTRRRLLGRYREHQFHGRAVAFSPDGRWLASCAEDIVLWDVATRKKILRLPQSAQVWDVAFSPDGRWLVSAHEDGAILLWDAAEREQAANFNEHSGSARAVAFSPDGKRLASASEDRSLILWDAENRRKEAVLAGHQTRVTGVSFSADGQWLASGDQDGRLIFWDLSRGQPRLIFNLLREGAVSYCIAISPDGRLVAASHGVYESADGRQAADFFSFPARPWLHHSYIYGMAFSPDGRWLACPMANGHFALLDTESWQTLEHVELSDIQFISVSVSPDGKWLVTGEDQGAVRLWQARPLRQVAVLGRHAARIKSVAFSPDGKQVASCGDDQTIALWDVERRRLITRIGTHTAPVLAVAFSPDGKHLASGEHDRSVRIYTRRRTLWGYRLD